MAAPEHQKNTFTIVLPNVKKLVTNIPMVMFGLYYLVGSMKYAIRSTPKATDDLSRESLKSEENKTKAKQNKISEI